MVAAGCGRISFDAQLDATLTDAAIVDAAALGPWGAPEWVVELSSSARDDDPSLTADMLEIVFNSFRSGGIGNSDLWTASRASVSDPFGPPMNLASLNTSDSDTTPRLSGDGLTLHFGSDRPGGLGQNDIYVTTRPTRGAAWSAPQLVVELNSTVDESAAVLSRDGLAIYFDSERGDGSDGIWRATRASPTAPWSTPVQIFEVDLAGGESGPFVDLQQRSLWFANDGAGEYDLFVATRASTSEPFGAPQPIPELSSVNDDEDPWVSDDGRVIYFSSDRSGMDRIYRATR